jgi:hypothetical protein
MYLSCPKKKIKKLYMYLCCKAADEVKASITAPLYSIQSGLKKKALKPCKSHQNSRNYIILKKAL